MENRVIWTSEDIEIEIKKIYERNSRISEAVKNIRPKKLKKKNTKQFRTKESYKRYLKTDWWRERRKKFWKYHPKKCYCCGGVATDIHHNNYSRLFEEKDKDLVPLCNYCHREVHLLQKKTGKLKYNHKIIKKIKIV